VGLTLDARVTRPFAADALHLRRWDDEAKLRGMGTPLDRFVTLLGSCLR
jgi:predicted HD phosphohydrolase